MKTTTGRELLRIVVVAVLVFASVQSAGAVGLPKGWEENVFLIEYARSKGKTCDGTPTFPSSKDPNSPSEVSQPEYCPHATGLSLKICNQYLIVSNRHVLGLSKSHALFVRGMKNDGTVVRLPLGRVMKDHPDPAVDLAATLVSLPAGVKNEEVSWSSFNEDIDRTAESPVSFLMKLEDVRLGDEVVFLGFPWSIPAIARILTNRQEPLLRSGTVAWRLPGLTKVGDQEFRDIVLIDGWAFGGNSGSPVFSVPTLRHYSERKHLNLKRPYIVGVISGYLDWNVGLRKFESVVKVYASTNSGLAIVQSAEKIEEVAALFPGANCPPPLPVVEGLSK